MKGSTLKRSHNYVHIVTRLSFNRVIKTRHEMVHIKEKPYQCAYCDKTFSRTGSNACPERIHTIGKLIIERTLRTQCKDERSQNDHAN